MIRFADALDSDHALRFSIDVDQIMVVLPIIPGPACARCG